ncbi:glutaminyl-tRNA synthetase [Cryptosporidium canis]|uniref:glutamine--tRNA ligase n=1 Tax=Cryptosporidium canis TaxID=195482 RepID=A0ABQ8PAN0_9CRYT|nr:glutaminyl-tRNA synthetase [Cryptosporidium canis]KAJ1611734.1 glutaminyl-tRNA synthetase [Cryptosporidium canis]
MASLKLNIANESVNVVSNTTNFIKQIVEDDLKSGKHSVVVTRFPPEPNGFLHLGHAKSICLNYGIAKIYNGRFHLRYDDTNPYSEEQRYIDAIERDVKWLGADWGVHKYYASDYFDQLYEWAKDLILAGKAYVDHQTVEEIRKNRGDSNTPAVESVYRNRSVEENMELFEKMKRGECEEGECVLRAKIDMKHGNPNLRDPILYRILKQPHPHTGEKWVIYPMYDFAHGQSDSIEEITHSICTLEFELHRPLYDWFQSELGIRKTRQIEFARLNMTYMVLSKRKLLLLVNENHVSGWDDPRMPTLSALRRKGYPPQSLWDFCDKIGASKRDQMIHVQLLEECVKDNLHGICQRRFACIQPLKVVIVNWDECFQEEAVEITIRNHPDDNVDMGERILYLTKYIWIEKSDFWFDISQEINSQKPPSDFKRLYVGGSVRLKYSSVITCKDVIIDESTKEIKEVHCILQSKEHGCDSNINKKKLTAIHWLSNNNITNVEFRLYGRLFTLPEPENQEKDWRHFINNKSLVVMHGYAEKNLLSDDFYNSQGEITMNRYQFERIGYFTRDVVDSKLEGDSHHLVYNLTVQLGESPDLLIRMITESGANESTKDHERRTAYHQNREKIAAERAARRLAKETKKLQKSNGSC